MIMNPPTDFPSDHDELSGLLASAVQQARDLRPPERGKESALRDIAQTMNANREKRPSIGLNREKLVALCAAIAAIVILTTTLHFVVSRVSRQMDALKNQQSRAVNTPTSHPAPYGTIP